ncbi:SGNH/GDSL hydrolase family protein [Peptoclostridium litorale]|nr:SGNH/GDSL hydrolase family protein [Peptoclostridium litorale]
MSIGPAKLEEKHRYGGILNGRYRNIEVLIKGYSGQTTDEGCETIEEAKKENADIVILGWGVNDALPRGLKRKTRSKIIRSMYKLHLGEKIRLAIRKFFLNPLEYFTLKLRKPHFYIDIEDTKKNFCNIIEALRKSGCKKIIVLSIAPVLNYRFINANQNIKKYNDIIRKACVENDVIFVDVYSAFEEQGIKECLDEDLFHYGEQGHRIVAEKVEYHIDELLK